MKFRVTLGALVWIQPRKPARATKIMLVQTLLVHAEKIISLGVWRFQNVVKRFPWMFPVSQPTLWQDKGHSSWNCTSDISFFLCFLYFLNLLNPIEIKRLIWNFVTRFVSLLDVSIKNNESFYQKTLIKWDKFDKF